MAQDEQVVEQGVHTYSKVDGYIPPVEAKVAQHLEWFQDQKLALMMHWGALLTVRISRILGIK